MDKPLSLRSLLMLLLCILPLSGNPADATDGLISECFACHPHSTQPDRLPALNGRQQADLLALLLDFKYERRPATLMPRIVKGFSDDELKALAERLSGI